MTATFGRTTTAPSEDDLAFLRARLGQYGLAGMTMGIIALSFHVPYVLSGDPVGSCVGSHLVGVLAMVAVWQLAKVVPGTQAWLRSVELGGTMVSTVAYGLMAYFISTKNAAVDPHATSLMVLLIMTLIVFARAALVPSTARWTMAVTGIAFVAVLPTGLLPSRAVAAGPGAMIGPLASAALWWVLTVTLAATTSSVIYGLRRDVKKAQAFGQYHLVEKIGEGGMGLVYRARHHMLRRETALKILPPARHAPGAIARFEREVQLTAQLTHANTVTIFDYGRTPDGLFYYTMELLDGATLEDIVLTTGPMPPARVARLLTQVASALAEAHSLGMVHRDIKPSNIMLCRQGGEPDVAKVLDFGLVRESIGPAGPANLGVTAQTEILGTPLFMSPEAIASPESVGPPSDLYSLGAVAVFLLTGKTLFSAPTLVEVCSHHLHSAPPRLGPEVPEPLEALVLGCLAKKAEGRPTSARALADALAALPLEGWSAREAERFWEAKASEIRRRGMERVTASSLDHGGTLVSATLDVDVARRLDETAGDRGAPVVLFPAG